MSTAGPNRSREGRRVAFLLGVTPLFRTAGTMPGLCTRICRFDIRVLRARKTPCRRGHGLYVQRRVDQLNEKGFFG